MEHVLFPWCSVGGSQAYCRIVTCCYFSITCFITQVLQRKRVSVTHLDAVDIEKLDLSVRTYQLLKRGNINTVKDLIEEGSEKLLKLRNMGPRSMDEIRQAVKDQFGYIID